MNKKLTIILVYILCFTVFISGCGLGSSEMEIEAQTEVVPPVEIDEEGIQVPQEGNYSFGIDTSSFYDREQDLEPDRDSSFGSQTQVLTAENPGFSHEGVGIQLSPVLLEGEEIELEIQEMIAPQPLGATKVNAYDFSINSNNDYQGFYVISIPYDGELDRDEAAVGAGYFNESTWEWEPVMFEVDQGNQQVIITTDHLSTFGSFTIVGENTRYARISSDLFEAHDFLSKYSGSYGEIIEEAINNNMSPGMKAVELGRSVVGDWLSASGYLLTFEGIAYSSEFISNLSDMMGNVGASMALVQLATDYSRGDERIMALNAFKNAGNFMISRWGTKALSVAMLGVTAIDYSLNRLANELIKGREEIWEQAYRLYYKENHARSGRDWYNRLRELQSQSESPDQFQRLVETEVNMYTYLFWNETEDTIAFYQSEAMSSGFTGGGGLNEKLKERIADAYKSELLLDSLEPVFRQVERDLRYEQFEEYQQELAALKDELNQLVKFEIQERVTEGENPNYAGYIMRFATLSEDAEPARWTGRLNEEGYISGSFTVLGHLMAGAPSQIELYETVEDLQAGNPELVVDFVVDVPHTVVTIGEILEEDLSGTWKGSFVITYAALLEYDISTGEATGPDSQDIIEAVEACEDEFGQAMMAIIINFLEKLIDTDIPLTMEFVEKEEEGRYSGSLITYISKALPEDSPYEVEDEWKYFDAVYKEGILEFAVHDEDSTTYYTGQLETSDRLSGTFNTPSGEMENFISGYWWIERIEADEGEDGQEDPAPGDFGDN
ncbi:MAG: hypothetical protein D5R97_00695 [Candidatus Syntrophonatronum acetioxidans]|uniref:Uncharacterized protein n=1 Tax=Candidatus Syntrophonatronum acetioxidans TaxID=1795816 RepID=A0A424YIN6_9FIRM|nr:MAG: hypothetical protein D5R97_00695 [Candidatus Syntrophonatronum acetioxidans]